MYTRVIFETAGEFFDACNPNRTEDDKNPFIPRSVQVIFDGDGLRLSGDGSEKFEISGSVSQSDMINEAFIRLNSKVYIT